MQRPVIGPVVSGPDTHPYIASMSLEPSAVAQLLRLAENRADVLVPETASPDQWTIFFACASREGWDLLESNG